MQAANSDLRSNIWDMEEFFGSEDALTHFEKTEAIEEKIRQLWELQTVQASY